jgi:WD40 repeat protein
MIYRLSRLDSSDINIGLCPFVIFSVLDGSDGSILSCSTDGTIRVWAPQRGRDALQNPFFECVFTMNGGGGGSVGDVWISCMAISTAGLWSCFTGESSGSIAVYRRPRRDPTGADAEAFATTNIGLVLTPHRRWERVHGLGVTHLALAREARLLVSLATDGFARVMDTVSGAIIFSMQNTCRSIYCGVVWFPADLQIMLCDASGNVELWSLLSERKINECSVHEQVMALSVPASTVGGSGSAERRALKGDTGKRAGKAPEKGSGPSIAAVRSPNQGSAPSSFIHMVTNVSASAYPERPAPDLTHLSAYHRSPGCVLSIVPSTGDVQMWRVILFLC